MLKLYNTLTRKKEAFKPLKGKHVNFFVCGPTTYDHSHIGHAKSYVQFDVIVRYLRYLGYDVFYLMNITDIDDKIIRRSQEENEDWKVIARKYEKSFIEDMKSIGVDSVNKYARATDYIKDIQSQVKRLIDKGVAYKISDGYYFDLTKFSDYGKLARRTKQHAEDGVSRIDEHKEKRNKGDFCLWKFSKENENSWKWVLGDGRPGWHIEDTSITEKEFGSQYDMHGGGIDLIFPHHEAEIAQMESISGKKPLVKYWLHTAFLKINNEKMSKSLKNFVTIKEALKTYDGKVLRFFFASNHYRTPVNFSYDVLEQSKSAVQRLEETLRSLKGKDNPSLIAKTKNEFFKHLNNDFDTPRALAVVFNFVREVNKKGGGKQSKALLLEIINLFGLQLDVHAEKIPSSLLQLAEKREAARKAKNWKEADILREKIAEKGYLVEDAADGFRIRKIA